MSIRDRGLLVRIGANDDQFRSILSRTQRDLKKFSKRTARIGKNLTRNITAPLGLMAGASLKLAGDFNQSMTKIQTLVGISASEVDKMKDSVKALSGETARSPKELADALFVVTSAGLRGEQALSVLERSAKASALGLGETKDIARATTAVLQAYKDSGLTASEATDQLTATVREGNLEASELAPVLGRVIGIASELGVSFSEVGASIATYTRLGVSAEEATTGLRGILSTIVKPTDKTRKALATLGLTTDQLRASVEERGLADTLTNLITRFGDNKEVLGELIPNVRALSAVLGTAGAQGEEYTRIAGSIADSNGIVNEGFETTAQTMNFKFSQALSNLQRVGVELGSKLIPIATKVLDTLNPILDFFANMSEGTQKTILAITGLVAVLPPLITAVGMLGTALGVIMSPISLVIAGIAGLIVVGKNMVDNWGIFEAELAQLWQGIKLTFQKGVKAVLKAVMFTSLPGTPMFKLAKKGFDSLSKSVAVNTVKFKASQRATIEAKKGYVGMRESLTDLLSGLGNLAKGLFFTNEQIKKTGQVAKTTIDTIKNLPTAGAFGTDPASALPGKEDFEERLSKMKASVKDFRSISEIALEGVSTKWLKFKDVIRDMSVDFKAMIAENISGAVLSFGETVGLALSGAQNSFATGFEQIVLLVIDFAQQIAKVFAGIGSLLLFVPGMQGVGAGILAGAFALQALTSGIKAGIQKRVSNREARAQESGAGSTPGFASGGMVPAGLPHVVGEKGAELRVDTKPGFVIPNRILKNFNNNNSGNPVYVTVKIGDRVILQTIEEAKNRRR